MKIKRNIILSMISVIIAGTVFQMNRNKNLLENWKNYGDKYYEYFQLLNHWMISKNEGKSVANFFKQEGISRIAVYGMGDFANRLTEELEKSEVCIAYGIDRDVCCTNSRIEDVCSPDDALSEVDAIIITPFLSAKGIENMLKGRCPYRLISLENIIYSL